jgi:excisionase family DNA binding protein
MVQTRMTQSRPNLEMLNVGQVASHLNVSTKTVRRMIQSGVLHHHRIGRTVRVSAEDLRAYANGARQ